jgi:hypothetical protein
MEPALVVGLLWLSFGAFHIGLDTYGAPDRKWFEGSAWLANVN